MQLLRLVDAVRPLVHGWLARLYLSASCECLVCGGRLRRFVPYRRGRASLPDFVATLGLVGSDVENYGCPRCGSHDRERHLFLYLRASGIFEQMAGARILHFAPEKHLSRKIESLGPAHYLKADLYPREREVVKVDILRMQFSPASFDWVIANHVMEHVTDYRNALSEIRRVLRPGGMAILQTPYASALHHTFEDAGINDDASRLQAYGQEDHVRLFGSDIVERFASAGFISRVRSHAELLPHVDTRRFGVNPLEPLFLFERA